MRGLAILPRHINRSPACEVGLFGIGAMRHEDLDDRRTVMAWRGPVIWDAESLTLAAGNRCCP
jgi:hypothetical protein